VILANGVAVKRGAHLSIGIDSRLLACPDAAAGPVQAQAGGHPAANVATSPPAD
jgi:hypothetical protein